MSSEERDSGWTGGLRQDAVRGLSRVGGEGGGRSRTPRPLRVEKCLWFYRNQNLLHFLLHLQLTAAPSPFIPVSVSKRNPSWSPPLPTRSPNHSRLRSQRRTRLIGPKTRGTEASRAGPVLAACLSAGGGGDGLLQLLAADLTGAGLQEQVVAGVAHQHRVVQLLVRDGQLQMATVFTEHVPTVPENKETENNNLSFSHIRTRLLYRLNP